MDNIPMRPPKLPGYDFVQMLGSGATATVYLYNQRMPARPVAVKASAKTLDPRAAALFNREANFMAKLSSHPYILPVYGAGVTSDGHGYIVIEYAPGGTYNSIMKARSMTCEQVLDLGIKLSSALFTAHRKGIIHRDIKPSNILINAHNMPMLADFGIAGSVYGRPGVGFTIAWAAPEVLAQGGGGNESSDIYSLGATLFAMLIGQSPYEYFYADVLGDSQRQVRAERLKSVILNNPLPKLNRPDVPAEVERVLRKALSRTPEDRYYSALEFARDMQRVQQALYGRAVQTTVEGVPDYPQNMYAQTSAFDQSAPVAKQHARWAKPLAVTVAAAAAVVVMALAFVTVVMPNMDASSDNSKVQVQNHGAQNHAEDDPDSAITSGSVPSVQDLTGEYTADGKVRFTWVNPSPKDGDSYAWSLVGDSGTDPNAQGTTTESTSIEIDPADGAQTCVQVSLVRADRQMSENPMIACAAKP